MVITQFHLVWKVSLSLGTVTDAVGAPPIAASLVTSVVT